MFNSFNYTVKKFALIKCLHFIERNNKFVFFKKKTNANAIYSLHIIIPL